MIYGPFTDELWTAMRGGPTRLNGRIVRVSRCARVEDAVIAMGFSKSKLNLEKSLPHVNRLSRRAMKIRIMGSAALELAYVACGRLDAYVERTINLWDIAAGALLVECAGGEFYTRPAPGGKFRMCRRQRPVAPETPGRQFAEIICSGRDELSLSPSGRAAARPYLICSAS